MLVLNNARVVLPDREIDRGSVVIEDGRIASVSEATRAEGLDLSGLVLLPGFIDVHIHGAVGIDVMDATAEQLSEISEYLASQGVTGWVPTFVPAADENYASAVEAISKVVRGARDHPGQDHPLVRNSASAGRRLQRV